MGPDFPEEVEAVGYRFFRKDTILLYLSYLQDESRFPEDANFWNTFYSSAWDGHPLEAITSANGWLYYCINENTHFCLETFLWHLLLRLEDKSLYLQEALELLKNEVIGELGFEDTTPLTFQDFAMDFHANGHEPFEDFQLSEKQTRKAQKMLLPQPL